MKVIKTGITRTVILTKSYAIKFPFPRKGYGWLNFVKGIIANINERDIWNLTKIEDCYFIQDAKPFLCPIIWSSWGAWIIVMPRCVPLKNGTEYRVIPELRDICGDHKIDNYGLFNGNLVCLDYGQI